MNNINWYSIIEEYRICNKCNKEQPIQEFGLCRNKKRNLNKYWRRNYCKQCKYKISKQWKLDHPEEAKKQHREARQRNKLKNKLKGTLKIKYCPGCKQVKSKFYFYIRNGQSGGLNVYCIACESSYNWWTQAKNRDKKKGQNTCTFEEWEAATNSKCVYCDFIGLCGADRIDNSKGHELLNIVPACRPCNMARSNWFSIEAMINEIGPSIKRSREKGWLKINPRLIDKEVYQCQKLG